VTFDEKAVNKFLKKDGVVEMLTDIKTRLEALPAWTLESLEKIVEDYCTEKQLGMGKVAQPIRIVVTGSTVSPSLNETLEALGKERTIKRFDRALAMLKG
jgi:glutamyl-tRNA synthetase